MSALEVKQSESAEAPSACRDNAKAELVYRAILRALKSYELTHHEYDDGSGGMRLDDFLSPGEDVRRGCEEVDALADSIYADLEAALGLKSPSRE